MVKTKVLSSRAHRACVRSVHTSARTGNRRRIRTGAMTFALLETDHDQEADKASAEEAEEEEKNETKGPGQTEIE